LQNTLGICVTPRRFAHFYDYEPDEASASGRKVFAYAEAAYPNQRAFRAACKLRKEEGHAAVRPAHEAMVDPLVRAMRELKVTPSVWVRVEGAESVATRVTTCDVEVQAKRDAFVPLPDVKAVAPMVRLYYDIETLGLDPSSAPVIQVSMVVAGTTVKKHLVAVRTVAPLPGVTVHECNSEADLLRTTRRLLVAHDPDVVLDYNGSKFDLSFLDARARTCGVDEFHYLSRFALRPVSLRELNLSSGGMGDNHLRYYDLPGRDYLDLFMHFKMSEQEMSYKLSTFARKYLQDDKEDMDYKEIPILQAGTPEDRARLGSYCVHDSYLLYLLDEKRGIVTEHLAYASVFCIPVEWVRLRGQQVRYISQLLEAARTAEAVPLLLNTPTRGLSTGDGGYEGAVVNDPFCGFHKFPVVTLDWMSLYPSLMQAHNLCPSTLVRDPKLFAMDGVVAHRVSATRTTHFQTKHKGILPRILESLLSERKLAKKEVKRYAKLAKEEEGGEAAGNAAMLASVFDKRQLALKVSANSIYGACGAGKTGKYPCLAVSETTTFRGRDAMDLKKELLPAKYPGIQIVYGDSVAAHTPLLLRVNGRLRVAACDTLFPECAWTLTPDGKEVADFGLVRVQSWTDAGWTTVRAVYRHRVEKPMYRVTTRTGTVDVTEDHSLLHADGTPCTAADVVPGTTALLHAWPGALPQTDASLTPTAAHELGGTTCCRDVHGRACVPEAVLNGSRAVKRAFVRGVVGDAGKRTVESTSAPQALGLYALLRDLGYAVRLASSRDGSSYALHFEEDDAPPPPRDDPRVVEAVTRLPHADGAYVYDLTTDNHHFHAGVGQMVVHNTDSVMVRFEGVTDVQEAGRLGAEAADYITHAFAERGWPQMVLEFETIKYPFLLLKKKRYVNLKWEPDASGAMVQKGIDAKGVETERRDTLPYLKDMMRAVVDALMTHVDEGLALRRVEAMLRDLVDGKVPLEKFVMSKSLSQKVTEKTDSIVVARVNALRKQREEGSEEAVGDRVPYVYLESSDKHAKAVDLAEDPAYAKAHGCKLNYLYYLDHCIAQPLSSLFEVIDGVDVKPLFAKAKADLERKRLGVRSIASFFATPTPADEAAGSSGAAKERVHVPRPPPPRKKARK
jgi:DNA polymerase elongation subunit (family B)